MSHHRRRWRMVLAALSVISRRDFRCEDDGKGLRTNFCLVVVASSEAGCQQVPHKADGRRALPAKRQQLNFNRKY